MASTRLIEGIIHVRRRLVGLPKTSNGRVARHPASDSHAGPSGLRLYGAQLLQGHVFGPDLLEDRDVGLGIFPEGEEILVDRG